MFRQTLCCILLAISYSNAAITPINLKSVKHEHGIKLLRTYPDDKIEISLKMPNVTYALPFSSSNCETLSIWVNQDPSLSNATLSLNYGYNFTLLSTKQKPFTRLKNKDDKKLSICLRAAKAFSMGNGTADTVDLKANIKDSMNDIILDVDVLDTDTINKLYFRQSNTSDITVIVKIIKAPRPRRIVKHRYSEWVKYLFLGLCGVGGICLILFIYWCLSRSQRRARRLRKRVIDHSHAIKHDQSKQQPSQQRSSLTNIGQPQHVVPVARNSIHTPHQDNASGPYPIGFHQLPPLPQQFPDAEIRASHPSIDGEEGYVTHQ